MAWRAEATRNARAERDAAAQALEQWRATPRRWWPSWAWNRGGRQREQDLRLAEEALASQELELDSPAGRARLEAALAGEVARLGAIRSGLQGKHAEALAAHTRWEEAKARLAEGGACLREYNEVIERLDAIDAAEREARAIGARLRQAEAAKAEREGLRARIASAEEAQGGRAAAERELARLREESQALEGEGKAASPPAAAGPHRRRRRGRRAAPDRSWRRGRSGRRGCGVTRPARRAPDRDFAPGR